MMSWQGSFSPYGYSVFPPPFVEKNFFFLVKNSLVALYVTIYMWSISGPWNWKYCIKSLFFSFDVYLLPLSTESMTSSMSILSAQTMVSKYDLFLKDPGLLGEVVNAQSETGIFFKFFKIKFILFNMFDAGILKMNLRHIIAVARTLLRGCH